jgi:hypothetical protein
MGFDDRSMWSTWKNYIHVRKCPIYLGVEDFNFSSLVVSEGKGLIVTYADGVEILFDF